jgi:hypothetical protein
MSTEVEQRLKEIWYSPKTGFTGAPQLYAKVKPDFPTLTLKFVREWLSKQTVQQITTKTRQPIEYSSVVAPGLRSYYQMDLMVYDRFEYHNYKYILVVVDVKSRFATARALTNRTMPNLMKNIEEIFAIMGLPHNIQCDNEFSKSSFLAYCKKNHINTWFSLPEEKNKNAIVERLNGTIANLLQKWRQATGKYDWYKVLPDIMDNYNNNKHSTTKAKPIDIWEGRDTNKQKVKVATYHFKVGDRCRIARSKGVFDKGDSVSYSKDIYTIRKIDGIRVYLDDYDDWVKPYQLKLVKGEAQDYEEPETQHEPVHQEKQKQRRIVRALNKEGIVGSEDVLRRSARERRPEILLEDTRYGKIKY